MAGLPVETERVSLVEVLSQECHSSVAPAECNRIAVSEELFVIAIAHGLSVDLYDMDLSDLHPELRRSLRLLTCTRFDSTVVEIQMSPHDPSLLACGTSSGCLCLLRLRRTPPPMERLLSHILYQIRLTRGKQLPPRLPWPHYYPHSLSFSGVCRPGLRNGPCSGHAAL